MARLAVVGGGITGLAAAYEASRLGDHAEIALFESTDRLGGKITGSPFAGQLVDEAADAFLARVPWAVDLCDDLGLTPRLTEPASRSAFVWSHGELRRLPSSQLLGVPTDLDELARTGLVSPEGIERARADLGRVGPGPEGDPSIGEWVRACLGDEVVDRLVGPLIGGINAGEVDRLSLRAAAAQIAAAADAGDSLIKACAAVRARAVSAPDDPVFHAPLGGMTELVSRLVEELGRVVAVRVSSPVTRLQQQAGRWALDPDPEPFDHVVVATHAGVAARLVATSASAAQLLEGIEHASVVMATLAFDHTSIGHDLDGSGFLVPSIEGRNVTACSFASSKWAHLGDNSTVLLRVSIGRDGDPVEATSRSDQELLSMVLDDLDDFLGLRAGPQEVRISRWPDSLPQYRPGHLDRMDQLDSILDDDLPGVVVVGAASRGLGIPACIQQGRMAVRRLAAR